jgi:hypothetical protein
MRNRATWLVLAGIGAVVVAGVVDSVRGASSNPAATRAGQSVVMRSTTTALSGQRATGAPTPNQPVVTTESAAKVTATGSAAPERLPSCGTEQLRLAFTVSDGLRAALLRRVKGPPCHHGRAPISFAARGLSGDHVAVFGGDMRTTQPADFPSGFAQLLEIPQMSCDPGGSFLVVATVGPYVARQTAAGSELPCNHG